MTAVDWLGSVAAVLTTIAFVPQVRQIWKTRSARDVSLPMYLLFIAGIALWLAYGLMLGAWPLIIANVVTLTLAMIVVILKIRWG
jgi:MtN3 and saliva related transmembrane protein